MLLLKSTRRTHEARSVKRLLAFEHTEASMRAAAAKAAKAATTTVVLVVMVWHGCGNYS